MLQELRYMYPRNRMILGSLRNISRRVLLSLNTGKALPPPYIFKGLREI